MKKDCSNIAVFMEEWERRRIAEPEEGWPDVKDLVMGTNMEVDIETLQKWSDEHPVVTQMDRFLGMYPNANVDEVKVIDPCTLDTKRFLDNGHCDNGLDCEECQRNFWNERVYQ